MNSSVYEHFGLSDAVEDYLGHWTRDVVELGQVEVVSSPILQDQRDRRWARGL